MWVDAVSMSQAGRVHIVVLSLESVVVYVVWFDGFTRSVLTAFFEHPSISWNNFPLLYGRSTVLGDGLLGRDSFTQWRHRWIL